MLTQLDDYWLIHINTLWQTHSLLFGKINELNGHGFNSKLLVYQRVAVNEED